jgi:hypothetical protein
MDLEKVAKVAFLVFVVFLFVYIIVTNKEVKQSNTKSKTEHYTNSTNTDNKQKSKTLQERIKITYVDLFSMPPVKEEMDFYVRFFKNKPTPSDQYLQEVISISAPTLKKTIQVAQPITKKELADGTEDEVFVIFNEILNRNPTPEELEFYSKMIKKGPAEVEKMKILLLQSQEYRMLQKMQSNKTNALTLRGVTDRQITFTVTNIYKNIARIDDDIDEETLAFLKKKYIDFNMDDELFKKFVRSMISFKASSPLQKNDAPGVKQKTQVSKLERERRVNSEVTDSLTSKLFGKGNTQNATDTSNMICEIQHKAKSQFPKSSETALSNEINNRNRDELRQICERNKKFLSFTDKDMVLLKDQSWTVPQQHPPVCLGGENSTFNPLMTQSSLIGTLIEDVNPKVAPDKKTKSKK